VLRTSILSFIDQHRLVFKLRPILVGELSLCPKLEHPAYVFKDEVFSCVLLEGSVPDREQINQLIRAGHKEVFIHPDDLALIKQSLEGVLIKITRSLSIGDPLENGMKSIKLLSHNLGNLYQNPHNDELLMLQFQSGQNLSKFFLENKRFQSQFFKNLSRESFHFTLGQPMLSSLLLLSFLQSIRVFHDKEMENLFLASYFKDIGFSMIPEEKYDEKQLSNRDKDLFSNHANFSTELLEGRIPLAKNYFSIIKHHHFMNEKMKDVINPHQRGSRPSDIVMGLESTLVAVFDILVAMTHERPYRQSFSMFQSLELIKKLMADEYPQEFKALVIFIKQFFKN
jgi:hypothetical protein